MNERAQEWALAIWASLIWFVTANIEALPGVWVAAFGGALYSAMRVDKTIWRAMLHIAAGIAIGIAISKLIVEVIALRDPVSSRVAVAFLSALFAEQIVSAIDRGFRQGDILKSLLAALPWAPRKGK